MLVFNRMEETIGRHSSARQWREAFEDDGCHRGQRCAPPPCSPLPGPAGAGAQSIVDRDARAAIGQQNLLYNILNQPAFAPFNAGELSPGPEVTSEEQVLDWVRRDGETALHPSCTAKMGTGPGAVVDPASMRVHGLTGLRVVDASVMPYVTNGNIYAPVMMIAEKAADLILGRTPLPAEPVEFYRHGVSPAPAPPSAGT